MATVIETLKKGLNHILPRTVLKAVSDDNGNYLDNQLTASDINILKNGKVNSLEANKVNVSDIVNDLTTTATNKPLSANQGKVLDGKISDIIATTNKINKGEIGDVGWFNAGETSGVGAISVDLNPYLNPSYTHLWYQMCFVLVTFPMQSSSSWGLFLFGYGDNNYVKLAGGTSTAIICTSYTNGVATFNYGNKISVLKLVTSG